jgi:hypothetical protein
VRKVDYAHLTLDDLMDLARTSGNVYRREIIDANLAAFDELAGLRKVVGPKCEACGQYALEHFQTTGGAMLSRKSPWPNWCPVTPEYESWMASREKR